GYAATVLGDHPFGYYRLGDTGLVAADSSPTHNDGVYTGTYPTETPPPLRGQVGAIANDTDKAADFRSSNNYNHSPPGQHPYVSIPDHPSQAPSKLTVEAWVTMTPGVNPQSYAAVVFKPTAQPFDGYGMFHYNGGVHFYLNDWHNAVNVPVSRVN